MNLTAMMLSLAAAGLLEAAEGHAGSAAWKRFDFDRNGTLDPEERAAARAEGVVLDKKEKIQRPGGAAGLAPLPHLPPLFKRWKKRFDVDGDGTLTGAEAEVARLAHQHRKERRRALERRFDANGDGTLQEAELTALRAAGREQRLLARFDANEDGRLEGPEQELADRARAEKKGRRSGPKKERNRR